jgi:hypothetical protein
MSMLSSLRERLGLPEQERDEFRVQSGSPAIYRLHADGAIDRSISAVKALVKWHVPLAAAKSKIEEVMAGKTVAVDLPMLEDAAAFEREMRGFAIAAVREPRAAAAEG